MEENDATFHPYFITKTKPQESHLLGFLFPLVVLRSHRKAWAYSALGWSAARCFLSFLLSNHLQM